MQSINDLCVAFVDLEASVEPSCAASKQLIRRMSVGFAFGTINGLMGSSGSGKTTLLKCLNASHRYVISQSTRIYLSPKHKIRSCLIGQDTNDRLLKGLTVRQSLIYASKLKNSCLLRKNGIDNEERVARLMSELMITEIGDNVVEKCSGGQMKRVVIAMELTSDSLPNLMFIDEPTTGLDTHSADILISILKMLSRKHRICIIASIHQPNSELLIQFDAIHVLAKEGRLIYSGPPQQLDSHLAESGVKVRPTDVSVEVLLRYSSKTVDNKYVKRLHERTAKSRDGLLYECLQRNMVVSSKFVRNRSKHFKFQDFFTLIIRGLRYQYLSQWKSLLSQIVFYALFLLCLTFAYDKDIGKIDGCFNLGDLILNGTAESCHQFEDQLGIIEQNLYHQYIASVSLLTIHTAINTNNYLQEIKIVSSEHRNKWYSTGSYFWAKTVLEQMPSLLFASLYTAIMYLIRGQPTDSDRVVKYFYISLMGFVLTQTLGSIVGIVFSRNQRLALFTSVALYSWLHALNNFIIIIKNTLKVWQVLSDYHFPNYLFNAQLIIMYGFGRCDQTRGQTSIVLTQYDVNEGRFWTYCWDLFYTYLVFKAVELAVLMLKTNQVTIRLPPMAIVTKITAEMSKIKIPDFKSRKNIYHIENDNGSAVRGVTDRKLMMAWIDMSYVVGTGLCAKPKTLLHGTSGGIHFGTLTGLLGPSGSGKTTLLKCLLGRQSGHLSAETKLFVHSGRTFRTCFVTQNTCEHLLWGLTVEQSLRYAGKLKNSWKDMKFMSIGRTADEMMDQFMIKNIRDTRVESCSGGEQKRIAIACELMATKKPNLLCIDEPTSGLDSEAALVVIKCLKALTEKHKISILVSIHQPNNELLLMFDTIHVLANGGIDVFAGTPDRLRDQLNECDIGCKDNDLAITCIDRLLIHCSQADDRSIALLNGRHQHFRRSLLRSTSAMDLMTNDSLRKTKFFQLRDLFNLLVRTGYIAYWCQFKTQIAQIIFALVMAVPLSNSFSEEVTHPDGCVSNTTSGADSCFTNLMSSDLISQNIKYHLLFMTLLTFLQLVITPLTFTTDVKIFLNQHANGWYSSGAYYWSKSIVDALPLVLTVLPFVQIMNKYHSIDKYLTYVYLISLSSLCSQSVGHISGIVFSSDTKVALIAAFAIHWGLMILGNTIVPLGELPLVVQYIAYTSHMRYIFECIMIMIYGWDKCQSPGQHSAVLNRFGISADNFWPNVRNLLIVFIALKVIALLALIFKTNNLAKKLGLKRRTVSSKTTNLELTDIDNNSIIFFNHYNDETIS